MCQNTLIVVRAFRALVTFIAPLIIEANSFFQRFSEQGLQRGNDGFRRGCTVSLREGATMSEYTVDWAINVSVGVQTFFFLLFRFIIFCFGEPRAVRNRTRDRRGLAELLDRCLSN